MPADIPLNVELLLRILFAAICGSVIGFERGLWKKEAGQRTHCVLAAAACTYMIVSVYGFQDITAGEADLTHIAAWTVCGINFLGFGIIFKDKSTGISGLSTATGLWATVVIGLACGIGMYMLSLFTTLILVLLQPLITLTNLDTFGYTMQEVRMEVEDVPSVMEFLKKRKKKYHVDLQSCEYTKNEDRGTITLRFRFKMRGTIPLQDVLHVLETHPEIKEIST